MTPPELRDELEEIHPAVMGTLVHRWAEARNDSGQSAGEHPHFREKVALVLEKYPEGYPLG